MRREIMIPFMLIILSAVACEFPGATATTSHPPEQEADATDTQSPEVDEPIPVEPSSTPETFLGEATGVFKVAMLVDLSSEPVDRQAAEAVLVESSQILQERTGFVFELIDYREMEPGGTIHEMAFTYLDTLAPQTPNGLVIFSYGDNDMARHYGGYSGWIVGSDDYRNDFVSNRAGDKHVYLAIMHWGHRYGICGYGDGEDVISDVSIGGECRGQPGIPCVEKYGYSMCSLLVDDLYASTPTFMTAAGIVHEFMHPFGVGTSDDHYATPSCKEIMGWTDENWSFSSEESQSYLNMCPHIYAAFDRGYQP